MNDALPRRVDPNPRICRPLYTVGAGVLVLEKVYDADQHWLPFVTAVFPTPPPSQPPETAEQEAAVARRKLRRRKRNPHANVHHTHQYIAIYEKGVPQRVMPFEEFRRVTHGEYDRLNKADFPAWDRTNNGDLLRLEFSASQRHAILEWCQENCLGRFYPRERMVLFESDLDAVCAKMVFYDPER